METLSSLPVLLVDDEPQLLHSATIALRTSGFPHVLSLEDSRKVMPLLAEQNVGVIVLDLTMPNVSGHTILEQVTVDYPDIPVIIMTATSDLEVAVQCMQVGAVDYLVKPVEQSRLTSSIRRALETRSLYAELLRLKDRLLTGKAHERSAFADTITQDRAMNAIFRYLEAICFSPQPVLITGETGTGKELVAGALHRLSKRPGELVAVNVAGLDDTLFSDALFGHAKGAYTGAERAREGLISTAADGTLFLDEIGDMTIPSQVKLLRLLQDGTYYPLGADRPRQSLARVVVATNCDIAQMAAEGRFRKDLYFRLRTHQVQLPPLRQRRDDIPLLVNHFVDKTARVLGKSAPTIPSSLYTLVKTYEFPGNVRELEAMVFDAIARHEGSILSSQSFKDAIGSKPALAADQARDSASSLARLFPDRLPTLSEAEEALIEEALTRAEGNQGIAAGMLGISRQAVNKRLSRRRTPARTSDGF